MADRFWLTTATTGGAWNSTANWSATSGGPGGQSVPTGVDRAFVSANITTNAVITTAAGINWPAYSQFVDSTAGANYWTLGAGTDTWSLNLDRNVEINVPPNTGALYNLFHFTPFAGANFNVTITGGGRYAITNSALVWSLGTGRLIINGSTLRAGTGALAGQTIEFQGESEYDTASTSALTLSSNIIANGTYLGVQQIQTGTVTFSGTVTWNTDCTLENGRALTISGPLQGAGRIFKAGASALTLSNTTASQTFSGVLSIAEGALTFQASNLQFASYNPPPSTNPDLDLYTGPTVTYPAGAVIGALGGGGAGGMLYVQRALTIGSSSNKSETYQGYITDQYAGTNTITKAGTGVQTLTDYAGGYFGGWLINAGAVKPSGAGAPYALGAFQANPPTTPATTLNTTVASGGTLWIDAAVNRSITTISIAGTGTTIGGSAGGALYSASGTTSLTAAGITLAAAATVRVDAGTFTYSGGAITDSASTFALTKTGAAEWVLNQSIDNSYDGGTLIQNGVINVKRAIPAAGASPLGTGAITLGLATAANTAGLKYSGTVAATFARAVTMTGIANAVFSFDGSGTGALTIQLASITHAGTASARTINLTGTATTSTWNMAVGTAAGYTIGLSKSGTGTWTLNNLSYTFTGGIAVTAGTLSCPNITYTAGNFTVTGGTLSGTITAASGITVGGGAGAATLSATVVASSAVTVATNGTASSAITCTTGSGLVTISGGTASGTFSATTISASGGTMSGDFTASTAFTITGGTYSASGAKYRGPITITRSSALTINGQILGASTGLTINTTGGAVVTISPTSNLNDYALDTTITTGSIAQATTSQNPATAGAGKVFGNSKVIVEGTLRTTATGSQQGRLRYAGGLTLKAGSTLEIGV